MSQPATLQDLLARAATLGLSNTPAYRFARAASGGRNQSDRDYATDRLRRFLLAHDGLLACRAKLQGFEFFARAEDLQDPSFSSGLRELKRVLSKTPGDAGDAERALAEALAAIPPLESLLAAYQSSLKSLTERRATASTKQDTKLGLLQSNLRFSIVEVADEVAQLPSGAGGSDQDLHASRQDEILNKYQAGLLQRARKALSGSEFERFDHSLRLLTDRADHPTNRRMRWTMLHQLRRALFATLTTRASQVASPTTFDDEEPTHGGQAVSNFWGAFGHLNRVLVEQPQQARYLLSEFVKALRLDDRKRLRTTSVLCNLLETMGAPAQDTVTKPRSTARKKAEPATKDSVVADQATASPAVDATQNTNSGETSDLRLVFAKMKERLQKQAALAKALPSKPKKSATAPARATETPATPTPAPRASGRKATKEQQLELVSDLLPRLPQVTTPEAAPTLAVEGIESTAQTPAAKKQSKSETLAALEATLAHKRPSRPDTGSASAVTPTKPAVVAEKPPRTSKAKAPSSHQPDAANTKEQVPAPAEPILIHDFTPFIKALSSEHLDSLYPLLLLLSLLELERLPGSTTLPELTKAFIKVVKERPYLHSDTNMDRDDKNTMMRFLEALPLRAVTTATSPQAPAWFTYSDGVLRTTFDLSPSDRPAFVKQVRSVVTARLRYFNTFQKNSQ